MSEPRPASDGAARQTLEHELHASEARFHQLVDAVTDYAIFMLDVNGNVATWNSGAAKNKGYQAREIIGQNFSVFYTPDDRAAGKPSHILETVRRDGRAEDESWRVRKDGTHFWANVIITTLRDQSGQITGFAKVTRDLTAQRAAEDELHASEARFHQLVDAVTDYAIFMLDVNGNVATWNSGAAKHKGYLDREIIGQNFSVFYTPEDRAVGKPARLLDEVRRGGRAEDEGWRVRKDDTRFWANVVITTLRGSGGEVAGFAKVTRDLTSQRVAEENQRELIREQAAHAANEIAREELEKAARIKDDFLATMSHELRTPLNAIVGWSGILGRKPREECKLERGLEVIARNAKAQTRLVDDLLDVSRIITGKLPLNLERTEVLALIFAAADVVRPAAEAKGVRLVVDVDPNIGATMADPDRLQQIVWNLLTNAVRFTPRGGRVTVTADRADSVLKLSVVDTGAGIRAENLPYIFERFRQVDSSTTRAHGGLGLGLSIVRHLAEAHGGSAKVTSKGLGHGAEFVIVLPIRAVNSVRPDTREKAGNLLNAETADATPVADTALLIGDLHVLVVDDDPDSLEILRDLLERAGARVTVAGSAREALASIDAGSKFDLILSDIGMPEVDGYGFIRRVRAMAATANVPAIALTAYARAVDVEAAKRAGFQAHLAKPVDEHQLINAIRTWGSRRGVAVIDA